ncbi:MAG: hypothetical protein JOZ69_21430 [Myxococcales bacterium]|nr:hypothetical protein [Myxococcales bacterium]
MKLPRLVRHLHVLAACLALTVAWPSLAPTAACADVVAWVARARGPSAVADDAGGQETAAVAGPSARPPGFTRGAPVHGAPAAARAVVVRVRLYLEHEALLC